ncbi:CRISPR/Cas system CSM-associated protein Csm5 (group 7 of RAMP superfamily) [Salibacterium salarium]|uniref:hypothetical protein n=1 Tax=Salibacterium salarium TaxID=284579 RepID=UPI0027839A49|nr:hypothetical protein [Salibacterium salarium]MDQ0297722.1 CRISPR/Cas system CSM-associated protein Csm5 (group 7 of RAMP superfamily) [Salibacterium salarium]
MEFLNHMDGSTITLIVGGFMLFGSFATINSRSTSKFDHDFAFLLLIAGIICIGFGSGIINKSQLQSLWPG